MEYALFQLIMAAIEEGKTLPKIPAEVRLKLLNDCDE